MGYIPKLKRKCLTRAQRDLGVATRCTPLIWQGGRAEAPPDKPEKECLRAQVRERTFKEARSDSESSQHGGENLSVGGKGRLYIPAINGEFAREDQILSRAQEFFLVVVQSATPEPLYALRDNILAKYREAFQLEKDRGRSDEEVRRLSIRAFVDVVLGREIDGLESVREFQEVRKAAELLYDASAELINWSRKFNLIGKRANIDRTEDLDAAKSARRDAVWPLVVGLETIFHWHFAPAGWLFGLRNPPQWRPPVALFKDSLKPPEILPPIKLRSLVQHPSPSPEHGELSEVDTVDWHIGLELERQFRARLQRDFELWLDRHVAERNESARSSGLIKIPGKREQIHFSWAARYQVRGTSAATIARECKDGGTHVTESAVENGVRRVLDLIRLERRSGESPSAAAAPDRRRPLSGRSVLDAHASVGLRGLGAWPGVAGSKSSSRTVSTARVSPFSLTNSTSYPGGTES